MGNSSDDEIRFSKERRNKIHFLLMEAEAQYNIWHNTLGKISHLVEGVDVDTFCGSNKEEGAKK